ncbi:Pin2-interacting protein X1 [Fasciolopsis buskii]|uniref:Pin2-interacting protein X1 n=1 Tax=Fasciolopsis buskii TaxID=27845 RepID=A0A8E0RMX6_9TREM|nr:Pin2-interacting protein X1 [Fasciolopsis buski]
MLAERRKKVRYSNNPCGNLWANDRCGFGRQMLERLGWIPGNGLGKNGDGIEKPIKVVHLQKVTSVVLKKVSFFTGNLSFSQDLALHHSRKPTCFLFPATSSIKPFQTVCL